MGNEKAFQHVAVEKTHDGGDAHVEHPPENGGDDSHERRPAAPARTQQCAKCWTQIDPARSCLSASGPVCDNCQREDTEAAPLASEASEASDVLGDAWKVALYASILVPFIGSWVIVLVSSIMYYSWRDTHPKKAAAINMHGWIAWLLNPVIWGVLYLLSSKK